MVKSSQEKFGLPAYADSRINFIRILPREEKGHKPAHAESYDPPVLLCFC